MRSGLWVCIKNVPPPFPSIQAKPPVWRKGTVVHVVAFNSPPDPEYWHPLELHTATDSVVARGIPDKEEES